MGSKKSFEKSFLYAARKKLFFSTLLNAKSNLWQKINWRGTFFFSRLAMSPRICTCQTDGKLHLTWIFFFLYAVSSFTFFSLYSFFNATLHAHFSSLSLILLSFSELESDYLQLFEHQMIFPGILFSLICHHSKIFLSYSQCLFQLLCCRSLPIQ